MAMALSAGDKLGPYEIMAPLGAGGMGEVYKARDTRLDRLVAVKVLPEHIAAREDLRARFEREAHTVASLNHPHICALYDIGNQSGTRYMVMELLEGETLAARAGRSAIPFDQAIALATQIADALDRAHRAGVTHRDVKPQNIILTRDGAKVLDFGLARSAHKPGPSESTLTAALTTEGTVMGTPQYMSPEQFEGKEADARSDIWAFGAVLYEMVTGRKAFQGKSYTSLVAAILGGEPAPLAVKPFTPAWLERLVKRCLSKDPEDRYFSMHDIVLELRSPAVESAPPAKVSRWPWAVAAVATVFAALVSVVHFRETAPARPVMTTSILPPDNATFNESVISPDGTLLTFTATAGGRRQLWVRPMHGSTAQPLAGTEGASYPFWSPDSRWIGFFAEGKLKKIQPTGGPAQMLCGVDSGYGGTWNPDGVIVYATGGLGLWRVAAEGGPPSRISSGVSFDRWPLFLPRGRRYLYLGIGDGDRQGIFLAELGSKQTLRLVGDQSSPGYAEGPAGESYLLFVRESTLMAQRLDAGNGALSGEAFPVAEGIGLAGTSRGAFSFSVSRNGILVYGSGAGRQLQLTWMDRGGRRLEVVSGPMVRATSPWLSPDEEKIAFVELSPERSPEVWVRDLVRGASTRLTFSHGQLPTWSPDGGRIVFSSNRAGVDNLYIKSASGAGPEELLLKSANSQFPTDWAGRWLTYTEIDQKTGLDLWVLPMEGDRKPVAFLRTGFREGFGSFAPDGKWIAYTSNESGRNEIYVQPYPATGAKWQVSNDGGRMSRWRRDGKELYWLDGGGTLMAADVNAGSAFRPGTPQALFETGITSANERFAVSGDGKRFVVPTLTEGPHGGHPLTVVQNWLAAAKR